MIIIIIIVLPYAYINQSLHNSRITALRRHHVLGDDMKLAFVNFPCMPYVLSFQFAYQTYQNLNYNHVQLGFGHKAKIINLLSWVHSSKTTCIFLDILFPGFGNVCI